VVQLLLDRGVDALPTTQKGWTPLHYASEKGHTAVVKLLLDNVDNASATLQDGRSLLHRTTQNGPDEVVRMLVEKDVDGPITKRVKKAVRQASEAVTR
jgi:serine/threonine-protein phosphatase 6 regulatory ankyrin repeat subunit B